MSADAVRRQLLRRAVHTAELERAVVAHQLLNPAAPVGAAHDIQTPNTPTASKQNSTHLNTRMSGGSVHNHAASFILDATTTTLRPKTTIGRSMSLSGHNHSAAIYRSNAFIPRTRMSSSCNGDDSMTATTTQTERSARRAGSLTTVRTFHPNDWPARRPKA